MSARNKLNQACANGVMLVAGLIAACAESWTVFITLTVIFTVLSSHAGDIRMSPRPNDCSGRRQKRRE
jgi:hypothetical protein